MNCEFIFLNLLQDLHNPILDSLMVFITKLGDMGMIWILLTILLCISKKTRKYSIVLGVALCIDVILCNGILKHLFGRVRPCDVNTTISLLIPRPTDSSFPSGHTSISFAVVAALYFSKNHLWKSTLILSILIAFSRMYLYVHYPTDILGGIVLGIGSGFLACMIFHKLKAKFDLGIHQL